MESAGAWVTLPKEATLDGHILRGGPAFRRVLLLVVGCWLLVVGCWLLVVGCWLLVVGCWLLVVGCWLLVVGCWLLVVVVVEWLHYSKRIIIDKRLTLAIFRRFSYVKCVFLFHVQ